MKEIIRSLMAILVIACVFLPVWNPVPVTAATQTLNVTGNGASLGAAIAYSGGTLDYRNLNSDDGAATVAYTGWPYGWGNLAWTHWAFTTPYSSLNNVTCYNKCTSPGTTNGQVGFYGLVYATAGDGYALANKTYDATTWNATYLNSLEFYAYLYTYGTGTPDGLVTYYYAVVDYNDPILPTVTSQAATLVTYGSNHQAQFNGNITYSGAQADCTYNLTNYGFVYDTSSHVDPGSVAVGASGYASSWSAGAGTYGLGTFAHNITGLAEGTTYYYRSYTQNAVGYDYSNTEQNFTTLQTVVTTSDANGVGCAGGVHYATLNGVLSSGTGSITWAERGFVYGTSSLASPGNVTPPAGYTTNVTTTGSYTAGSYSAALTGLIEGTTYYFRAFAKDSNGYWYGSSQKSFTALSHTNVTTVAATEVATTSAKLNGLLSWDGNQASDVRFGYGNTSQAVITNYDNQTTWVNNTYTSGQSFYANLYGLTSNTTYYFRAQAANDVGATTATNELTFTTYSGIYPPGYFAASSTATTLLLTWVRGEGSTTTYIRYRTGSYPNATSEGALAANSTLSSVTLTGLTPGTSYYFSAWGWSGGAFSSNSTALLVTTTAGSVSNTTTNNYTSPSTLYQNTTTTNWTTNPVYEVINRTAESYDMPDTTLWMPFAIILSMAAGIWIYSVSNNMILAMLATGAGIGFSAVMGILPMWTIFVYVLFGITVVIISTRYGG